VSIFAETFCKRCLAQTGCHLTHALGSDITDASAQQRNLESLTAGQLLKCQASPRIVSVDGLVSFELNRLNACVVLERQT